MAFLGKVEKKVEKKMPVLSVKKPRTEASKEAEAEKAEEKNAEAETTEPAEEAAEAAGGATGIGLAYSDSESES